jgi:hypothetical protein
MNPTKGIVYYTDHRYNVKAASRVQKNLASISKQTGIPIVSVSLKRMGFGNKNIHFPHYKVGPQYLYRQILAGLENLKSDIVYICGPNVLYNASHFSFVPPRNDNYYFNTNTKRVPALHFSTLVGYRDQLIKYFQTLAKKPVNNPKTPFLATRTFKSDLPIEKV